jgi:adenosylcobinamide-GDP ribazoletransferase
VFKENSPFVAPLAALQFLTLLPPLIRRPFSARELGGSTAYYPLIGALIGLLLWGVDALLASVLPVSVRSALVLALWVVISGALHLDGFLDSCDGLFGGFTPESRLEIMRDERTGAYALTGGILLLLIKFTALNALAPELRPGVLISAPTLGRWSMTVALGAFPYAREGGLGRQIKDNTHWLQTVIATILALLVSWVAAGWIGLACVGVAGITTWIAARFTLKRIPGLTGDIYGAINETVETVILLCVLVASGLIL